MPSILQKTKTSTNNLKLLVIASLCLFVAACSAHGPHEASHAHEAARHSHGLPPGSNEILRSAISGADDLEVIISDVIIPAGASVPKHYHPGEEFLYLIEGSAIHREEGQPDRLLKAGDTYVIPPRAAHNPQGGPNGARAIVFRVHKRGNPERILVDE